MFAAAGTRPAVSYSYDTIHPIVPKHLKIFSHAKVMNIFEDFSTLGRAFQNVLLRSLCFVWFIPQRRSL